MSCKGQEMPTLGILGMTAQKSVNDFISASQRWKNITERTGTEAECKCTFDHIDDPEDGEVGIYREEC